MPFDIIPFLVAHFDHVNRIHNLPNNRGYVINADDVLDIFGLPLNLTNQIKIKAPTHENGYDAWVKTLGFPNPDAMRAKHLPHLFTRFPDGGDEFKKLFVLYDVSILLAPFPDFKIRKIVYSAISNPAMINTFDWCSFTLESLCDTVRRVKGDNRINFVNRCVLVLLVCYYYRFPFQGDRILGLCP